MRFFLISDNSDAMNGLRLAGIEGTVARSEADLRQALENLKQATAELHSTLLEMQEVAEKNRGEFPDINRIAEEVLVQSRKGEDEP